MLTDLSTFHDYNDAPALEKSCETLDGILGTKLADRDFFVRPIAASSGGGGGAAVVVDEGTRHRPGAPVLCTEFGGVNIKPADQGGGGGDGDDGDRQRDWGYTTASDPSDLLRRIERLAMAVVRNGHICGVVYTQL